jgi:hypothetical protein
MVSLVNVGRELKLKSIGRQAKQRRPSLWIRQLRPSLWIRALTKCGSGIGCVKLSASLFTKGSARTSGPRQCSSTVRGSSAMPSARRAPLPSEGCCDLAAQRDEVPGVVARRLNAGHCEGDARRSGPAALPSPVRSVPDSELGVYLCHLIVVGE